MRQRKMTKAKLKIKAWDLLSKIIRLEHSDENGHCSCVTCGNTKHWTELQAGHFVPKSKGNSIYFLENNIHPQCVSCNIFNFGEFTRYTVFMIDSYGVDEVNKILELSKEELKITVNDYEDMIEKYKTRLKILL